MLGPMSAWFGDAPFSRAAQEGVHVPRPLGQPCYWCAEPITEADEGYVTPCMESDSSWTTRPVHVECQTRSVVGPLAHLEKRCLCFGGTDHETPGLTRRQESIAVENYLRWHGLT